MSGVSSCRPARLRRHRETTGAIADGLATRVGHLADALQAYRSGCDVRYRPPTVDTDTVVADWGRAIRELGEWTGEVGDAFIRADAIRTYTGATLDDWGRIDYDTSDDTDDVWTMPTEMVVDHLDGEAADDPFLGVPEGGFSVDDLPVGAPTDAATNDELLSMLEDLDMSAGLLDNALTQFLDVYGSVPTTTRITVTVTSTHVLFLSDGTVIRRMTRAEATARIIAPRGVPSRLATLSRWSGRVGGALTFATGALSQWQQDAALPTDERILRTGTKGLGILGGALAGGAAGGTAGALCGPGAPVCSTVLGFAGGLLGGIAGGIGGGWLVDLLPWMDPPPDASIGEYDLGAIEDEIAQSDGELSGDFAPIDAATSLVASDVALAETRSDPDVQAHLESILPDRDDLLVDAGLVEPEPVEVPTGTTTTIPAPSEPDVPTQPPSPSPGPAPTPDPSPGPSPSPPTGTTVPGS